MLRSVCDKGLPAAALTQASHVEHEPGARDEQAGAGAGQQRGQLLHRYAPDVRQHHHERDLEPRCEAATAESAASKTVALSYSSWRFHHP